MEEVNGRLLRKKRCEGEGEERDDGHAHPVDYDKARPRRHTASTTHAVAVHCAVSAIPSHSMLLGRCNPRANCRGILDRPSLIPRKKHRRKGRCCVVGRHLWGILLQPIDRRQPVVPRFP
ncbi:hypothetical protein BHM03_00045930 [Ensete ventricosum]|nr:hypothetical protein BHM03_00045930 [Ensete ventricosum]